MSCGGNCGCACGQNSVKEAGVCATPKEGVTLDQGGKCPCGKELKDCCHKDVAMKNTPNDALEELCAPVGGDTLLCGDPAEEEKTA